MTTGLTDFFTFLVSLFMGHHGKVSGENLETSQPIIVPHRTDAVEIVKGKWPLRNFNAFFSYVSLPWEVLPTVTTTLIVPWVSPVVAIISADSIVPVRSITNVDRARNAVKANASAVCLLVLARTTTTVDRERNAVITNASVVRLLAVPARTTTNVDRAGNAVIANASIVGLLAILAHTTTNVDRARNAVIANAAVVRLLVPVRPTTSVTVESIAVGEFVRRTVVGAAELLQAQLSARLSSSPS